jgi:hypothetical protein
MVVWSLRRNRLADKCQRWFRGRRDRRYAHTLAVERAMLRIALYHASYLERCRMNDVRHWWACLRFIQSFYRLRFHNRNQAARDI